MTTDLYLIAHKVSGEPGFDIATRMECPECRGRGARYTDVGEDIMCYECEANGFWWIIPTSGHRAYPASSIPLNELDHIGHNMLSVPLPIMDGLPDHYHHSASPSEVRDRLASLIASLPPAPKVPFKRRF